MNAPDSIPIIDLEAYSKDPSQVAKKITDACAEWGFFYVKNHGIPQADVERMFDITKKFFASPEEVKLTCPYDASENMGYKPYVPVATGANGEQIRPDPREAMAMHKFITELDFDNAGLPSPLQANKQFILDFQKKAQGLARRILECFALALDLPVDYFAGLHRWDVPSFDNFELMHYPAPASQGSPEQPLNRISPHTDWGSLTLLFQQSVSGLQVRPPEYTSSTISPSETWVDAPVYNDMILINLGDMLEAWSAGVLKSTYHRVTTKTKFNKEDGNRDRWCMAYFLHPSKTTVMKKIPGLEARRKGFINKYPETRTAEEHLLSRALEAAKSQGRSEGTIEKVMKGATSAVY